MGWCHVVPFILVAQLWVLIRVDSWAHLVVGDVGVKYVTSSDGSRSGRGQFLFLLSRVVSIYPRCWLAWSRASVSPAWRVPLLVRWNQVYRQQHLKIGLWTIASSRPSARCAVPRFCKAVDRKLWRPLWHAIIVFNTNLLIRTSSGKGRPDITSRTRRSSHNRGPTGAVSMFAGRSSEMKGSANTRRDVSRSSLFAVCWGARSWALVPTRPVCRATDQFWFNWRWESLGTLSLERVVAPKIQLLRLVIVG